MYTLQPEKKSKDVAVPKKKRDVGGMMAAVILVVGVVAFTFMVAPLFGYVASNGTSVFARTAASVDDFDACYMAQKFMRDALKAPSTATFAPCRAPESVVTQTNRIWHVRSWVDAQNGFGAMLRNHFTADLIYYPATDTWTLVNLTTLD